jgi:hypothetical protein
MFIVERLGFPGSVDRRRRGCIAGRIGRRRRLDGRPGRRGQGEGGLNTIALPRDWCNYGQLIDGFTAKYGIPINGLNPGGGSKDELEAIKANKTNPGPQAPDVVDVGLSYGPQGVTEDLYSRTRSRPGTRSRRPPRTRPACGTATTTASCRSRSTPRS